MSLSGWSLFCYSVLVGINYDTTTGFFVVKADGELWWIRWVVLIICCEAWKLWSDCEENWHFCHNINFNVLLFYQIYHVGTTPTTSVPPPKKNNNFILQIFNELYSTMFFRCSAAIYKIKAHSRTLIKDNLIWEIEKSTSDFHDDCRRDFKYIFIFFVIVIWI